jgi:hypothetical protein
MDESDVLLSDFEETEDDFCDSIPSETEYIEDSDEDEALAELDWGDCDDFYDSESEETSFEVVNEVTNDPAKFMSLTVEERPLNGEVILEVAAGEHCHQPEYDKPDLIEKIMELEPMDAKKLWTSAKELRMDALTRQFQEHKLS